MAVTKITYENKTAIQNDTSVARKNKVVDKDMNEIKQVVNNNANELTTAKDNIEDLQSGQGTASADITSLKNRVSTLERDNTKNKSDINTLKSDNQTNKSNISTMQGQISAIQQEQTQQNKDIENLQTNDNKQDELISKLKNALINAETEESKSLHVTDANKFGQLEVLGNHEQETSLYSGNLERGSISESGTVDASNRIRTAEYIEVRGNTEINVSADGANEYLLAFYNSNKEYIQSSPWANLGTSTAIIANSQFVKVLLRKTDNSSITVSDVSNFIVGPTPSPNYPSPVKCLGSNKQLFDKSTAVEGILQGDGTLSYSDNNYSTSDFIKVVPKKSYYKTITGSSRFKFFDEEKSPISSTYNDLIDPTKAQSFEIPENAHYIRFTFLKIYIDEIKIEEGTEATSYSPYGQGSTKISKINKNLFNKETAIQGLLERDGSLSYSDSRYYTSDFIQVIPGQTYYKTYSGSSRFKFFDKNKNPISNTYNDLTDPTGAQSFEIPENVHYIRFTFLQTSLDSIQIEKSSDGTEYIEHQQTDYILNIQQEMLKGDYFAKEADGWKEVHNYPKINSDNFDNITENTAYSGLFMLTVEDLYRNDIKTSVFSDYYKAVTPGYMNSNLQTTEYNISAFTNNRIFITHNDFANNLSGLKNFLIDNNVSIFAKTTTPTKLACTPEQSAVLEELNNLDLFDGVNNIITAEDIALLKLKYSLDVETYVDNKIEEKLANINQQILEIVGGN